MANRKTGQEIEKCFKQVNIGVEAFDEQYRKYEQSTNASQRDKLVDSIKRECKKLQRLRDQIKTWAAGNDVKDKGPLQEKRELIETKMEAFKAVEKEMKTKAFSKEGLTAAAKLDPRDKEKAEVRDFLDDMTAELGRQVESIEAEIEQLQGHVKKSKRDSSKAERVSELEVTVERHKWHQGKLELLIRALDNDSIDAEQAKGIEDGIKDYVDNNQEVDFVEDEYMYEDFNLDEAEEQYGLTKDLDKATSHDDNGGSEEAERGTPSSGAATTASSSVAASSATAAAAAASAAAAAEAPGKAAKAKSPADAATATARRPSQQIKSPLPALADMGKMPTIPPPPPPSNMRPAPPPSLPSGGPLKYASAAAVAVANDKAGIGIAPLPPPPLGVVAASSSSQRGGGGSNGTRDSAANSPAVVTASLHVGSGSGGAATAPATASGAATTTTTAADRRARSPGSSTANVSAPSPAASSTQPSQTRDEAGEVEASARSPRSVAAQDHDRHEAGRTNGVVKGEDGGRTVEDEDEDDSATDNNDDEAIYHLPASLQELVESLEATRRAGLPAMHPEHQRQLLVSMGSQPDTGEAERPRHYRPANASLYTPPHFPQVPLAIFDDPRLYGKIDTDSLFYSFYYRQNTYQQYLAAKALKGQSWRFHKQYQTWFQRHEEPKHITEDFEQGTYRFFDYESTWMNRRKADFKFAYKYLEDDL